MYVNDPIGDMLTRIRNANMVYHETVDMPISKVKLALAERHEGARYGSHLNGQRDDARRGGP